MTRTATEIDLYRRVQALEDDITQSQQGILQGTSNPYLCRPCDYATTANVNISSAFTSITDVAAGSPTLPTVGGMRILVWMQSNKIENGIYEVGADYILRRSVDMPDGQRIKVGARIYVINGYNFGNKDFFVQTGDQIVGSTGISIAIPKGSTISDLRIAVGGNNAFVPAGLSNVPSLALSFTTPPFAVTAHVQWRIRYDAGAAVWAWIGTDCLCTPTPVLGANLGFSTVGANTMDGLHNAGVIARSPIGWDTLSLAPSTFYTLQVRQNCQGASLITWNGDGSSLYVRFASR